MLGLEHLATLMIFILLGGFGMAAMQDGMVGVWKRFSSILTHHRKATVSPRTPCTSIEPLVFRR